MASKSASRALRRSLSKQLALNPCQRRGLFTGFNGARPLAAQLPKATCTANAQQWRGMKTIDFAGTKETVYGLTNLIRISNNKLTINRTRRLAT